MFKVNWSQPTPDQTKNLLARAGHQPMRGPLGLALESLTVEIGQLPAYGDQVRLIRFTGDLINAINQTSSLYALDTGETLSFLRGQGPQIHAVNDAIGFEVTRANVVDYLQFYCYFVRGEDGPFYIIYDEADPLLSSDLRNKDVSTYAGQKGTKLSDILAPPCVLHVNDNGSIACTALVYYNTAIFAADFTVNKNGTISMDDDDPVIVDLERLKVEVQ